MYLIGYDIGSSSIKAALVSAETGKRVAVAQHPSFEMDISAPQPGWAEQDPEVWWTHLCAATQELLSLVKDASDIKAIGISYQMHGLVLLDKHGKVLRPSIIWCDSRAVEIGRKAFDEIGHEHCLSTMLNSPGNFTASKLRWVQENEPDIYARIHKCMLPGDYIAYRLSGSMNTTISGLSEGMFWDFKNHQFAERVLQHYAISRDLIPDLVPSCGAQAEVSSIAAQETGLPNGITIGYRAGDQPNNALALNVLKPGEVAATGGTSGVVYGVVDAALYDEQSRVNGFAHVNHTSEDPRIGILLCINGAGRMYGWLRQEVIGSNMSYSELERMAQKVKPGADGLRILPFGNGAERMLDNRDVGAQLHGLQLNRHTNHHLIRATLEGIAFAFCYGIDIMKEMHLKTDVIRVGNDNLFQSKIFSQAVADLCGARIEIADTTGAVGAALAGGCGAGFFASLAEAMKNVEVLSTIMPEENNGHDIIYEDWQTILSKSLEAQ